MIEPYPEALSDEMGRAWADSSPIESFLPQKNDGHPIHLVGKAAASLRASLARKRPGLRLRAVCVVPPGETHPVVAARADIHYASASGISELLLPRSRTLILSPFLAQGLLLKPAFFRALSLKTFEWVIAPFFVRPEPFFTLYSDQFSFEERLGDDDAGWCWTERPGPAVVWIVNGGDAGDYSIDFTLTAIHPGTFEINLGNGTRSRKVTQDSPTHHFRLMAGLVKGMNALRINFDGPPGKPANPADQREKLYFCFANLRLDSPRKAVVTPSFGVSGFTALRDRTIRRVLHEQGFFEIQTIGSSTPALEYAVGLRSCFDYREGFRIRDYRRFALSSEIAKEPSLFGFPALWYCLRKTPTAGSEWENYEPYLAENPTTW